jgi:hypothetical protein
MQASQLQTELDSADGEDKSRVRSWGRMVSFRNSSAKSLGFDLAAEIQPNAADGDGLPCSDQSKRVQCDDVHSWPQEERGCSQHATKTEISTQPDGIKSSAEQRICVFDRSPREQEVGVGENKKNPPVGAESGDVRCDWVIMLKLYWNATG